MIPDPWMNLIMQGGSALKKKRGIIRLTDKTNKDGSLYKEYSTEVRLRTSPPLL